MESNFDYIEFANKLKKQTRRLVPYELLSKRDFVANKVEKHIIKLAKGFETENFESDLNDEIYEFVCQVICEWTFHKCVDLLNSHIPPEYYDEILDNIGYVIYELLKQYVNGEISPDDILDVIETKVKIEYQRIIEDFERQGIINESEKNCALSQSSLDSLGDNSNFYSIAKSESQLLKDKVLISYAENLIYKYMLKAARVLKKNDYKINDRRIIITALKNALQMVVTRLEDFNKFELNFQIVERFITIATEIIFQRVITLHNLDILDKTSDMLDILACVVIDYETFYLRYAYDIRESFFWTNLYANQDFKHTCKQYLDDGTITKKQYKNILKNSKIKFLKPTIKKIKIDKSMYPKGAHKRYWTFMIIYLIIVITFITICKYH